MNQYQDKWTRYHDKPCTDGKPSSNNGWVYTAYSKYLVKDPYNLNSIVKCYLACRVAEYPLRINRSPSKILPPMSKDEIIGLASLGLVSCADLAWNHWNFCNLREYNHKPLTLSRFLIAVKALWEIRKEHRNYVWEEKITEAYPLAFRLAPWDTYYIRKMDNVKVSIFETICFYLNFFAVLLGSNKSTKMLEWLKVKDLDHPLKKLINQDRIVRAYFGEYHPFVKGEN